MDNRAAISFVGYVVNKIDFKTNQEFKDGHSRVKLDLDFDVNIQVDKEKHIASVLLGCIINDEYETNNKPFFLHVAIEGIFTFETDADKELIAKLINNNTVAILFPYLRAIISTITINCGINAVMLPTINIVEFLKKKENTSSIQSNNIST
jgi:preprotein translocase subunit SecB